MIRVIDAIADFVPVARDATLPETVQRTVVDAITDSLGVGLAGSRQPIAAAVRSGLAIEAASGGPILLGFTGQTGVDSAAVYNGAAIHALDFDDTNHPAYAHPSSHLVPVILAVASERQVDGATAVAAYAAGLEIEARLGATMNMDHYLHGWHTTGTFGALASTTAASCLYGLDAATTRMALAIASSMASGLRANFGTMTKPLHAGLAARAGVQAARLAAAGFTASPDAIDGRFGYLATFLPGEHADSLDPQRLASWSTLGDEWLTVSPFGLAIKPYPSCGATHPAIEAAIGAANELDGAAIASVRVRTTENSSRILIYSAPTTGLQGKFSMQYCVAAAINDRAVTLDSFTDEAVARREVTAIRDRIAVGVHPQLRENTEFAAEVEITTTEGRTSSRVVELAAGKRDRWMSPTELAAKFVSCATPTLDRARAGRAFDAIQGIADAPDVADLLTVLRP